jgi:hypothetical protein
MLRTAGGPRGRKEEAVAAGNGHALFHFRFRFDAKFGFSLHEAAQFVASVRWGGLKRWRPIVTEPVGSLEKPLWFFLLPILSRIDFSMIRNSELDRCGILFYALLM